jgi:hypothetical protein
MTIVTEQNEADHFFACWRNITLLIVAALATIGLANAQTNSSRPAAAVDNSRFASATEAWGMLLQVFGNLEEKVQKKDLASIHSEDLILSASLAALERQASRMEPAKAAQFKRDIADLNQHVSSLHFAGDTQQQPLAEKELAAVTAVFQRIKDYFPASTLAVAREMGSKYVCPTHTDVVGKRGDVCSKCGAPLDQQVRVLPAYCGLPMPGKDSTRATITTDKPVAVGQAVTGYLQLSRTDGSIIYASDLLTVHGAKIHLLMIDGSLTDYHHEHPKPVGPGRYAFPFTAQKLGPYYAWAEIRAQPIGYQEYAMARISGPGASEPVIRRVTSTNSIVDNLAYQLSFDRAEIGAARPVEGRLRISRLDGTPFTGLEPIMETFAHLVGFYEDHQTVLHIHPKGKLITDPKARGGPEIEFQLFAPRSGFVRLFAQVQVEGVSRFAPFGIMVGP